MSVILEKNNTRKIWGIVGGAILFYWVLQNLPTIFKFLGNIANLIAPFLVGLAIALILNIPMRVVENKLSKKIGAKQRRLIGLILTILILLTVILLALLTVIPEIVQTFEVLLAMLPSFIDSVTEWGKGLSAKFPNLGVWFSKMDLDWDNIGKNAFSFLKSGVTGIMNSTASIAKSIFSGVLNFLIGLVFAVYILFQKENLARQTKKLLYAFLPEAKAEAFVRICSLVNQTFAKFITGQCMEAVILGMMFLVTMSLFRFPYAIVISILVTCTALVPIFGAFVACFTGAFLILVTSPVKAVWFIMLFLVLQQIEGNLIYPRVVGSSVGLPGLWVMLAVIIGGGMMGVTGMLISVPLCSVLYVLLRESIDKRLAKKRIPADKT